MDFGPEVLARFENPVHAGSFGEDRPDITVALVGAPERGEVVRLELKIDGAGFVVGARFKAFGGAETIASAALACELVEGRGVNDAARISVIDLASRLQLPSDKLRSPALVVSAIQTALSKQSYRG